MLFLNIIVFYLSFFVLLVSLDSLMCFVDVLCKCSCMHFKYHYNIFSCIK